MIIPLIPLVSILHNQYMCCAFSLDGVLKELLYVDRWLMEEPTYATYGNPQPNQI